MPSKFAMKKALDAWNKLETEKMTVDFALAEVFANIIDDLTSRPWLGNATTKELLREVETRLGLDGRLEYKTVGGKDVQKNEHTVQDLRSESAGDGKELPPHIPRKSIK